MRNRILVLAALVCSSCVSYAQAAPDAREPQAHPAAARYQLFVGYSFQNNTYNGAPGHEGALNGVTAALDFPHMWRGFRFKAQTTIYHGNNYGAKQNVFDVVAGFLYDWKIKHENVYAEALFGDMGINSDWGPNGHIGEAASFTPVLGGGIDTPVSRRFAIRVGADMIHSNLWLEDPNPGVNLDTPIPFPGKPSYFARATTGLVWKF